VYLARKTLQRVEHGKRRAERQKPQTTKAHREMMTRALADMEGWLRHPSDVRRQRLWDLLHAMREEQNEYKNIKWGAVRLVRDFDLLLFEYALRGLLEPHAAGHWAYQTARLYAERYHPGLPTGLVPESAPLLQDIVDFWSDWYGIDLLAPAAPAGSTARPKKPRPRTGAGSRKEGRVATFTRRQGQFLAFIHLYRKLHRRAPAELDLVKFFGLTPPSVHGMVVKLTELALITREPGVARSIRLAIPAMEVPDLEVVQGPPW
jgi:hypothetical protein